MALTSGKRLRQHLGREGGFRARARGGAVLLLQVMLGRVVRVVLLAQHVPPAAVQEAVQDVRGDDVRQGERLLRLEARLQAQRRAGEDGAHDAGQGEVVPGSEEGEEAAWRCRVSAVVAESQRSPSGAERGGSRAI